MRIKIAVLILFIVVFMVPLVRVNAQTESFTVYTDKTQYALGATAYVYVKANYIFPRNTITVTDVVVTDPNGHTAAAWHGLNIVLSDTTTSILVGSVSPTLIGTYSVSAQAFGCSLLLNANCNFLTYTTSVPEVPFGTIGVAAALLAAMCLYFTRKKHAAKK